MEHCEKLFEVGLVLVGSVVLLDEVPLLLVDFSLRALYNEELRGFALNYLLKSMLSSMVLLIFLRLR
jgi:hypothetical protein